MRQQYIEDSNVLGFSLEHFFLVFADSIALIKTLSGRNQDMIICDCDC